MTHVGDAFVSSSTGEDTSSSVGESVGDPPADHGLPSTGDMIADRYRLERHIIDDNAGRQVWRGIDTVLSRPVAIVMRHPGGSHAEEMLQAAVTASRVGHANMIGVYDAIDHGDYAFVVREWIDGAALRDLILQDGQFDAERTTYVLHAVAEAVAALHMAGMAHGNVHPGTVLIGDDGRVVLTDARLDETTSQEADIRALGACGYFMLTGAWPLPNGGLPQARRTPTGTLMPPRQVRAGVPTYLDDLVMDLLNEELAPPSAPVLAAELSRLDTGDQLLFGGAGTLRFADDAPEPTRSPTKLVAIGGTALALVIAGMVLGIKALNANAGPNGKSPSSPSVNAPSPTPVNPRPIALNESQVRIVDPDGNGTERKNAGLTVDGNPANGWKTERYSRANFGGTKSGMGILIKLDQPARVIGVKVEFSAPGVTAELRSGDKDFEATTAGDRALVDSYQRVGSPLLRHPGTRMVFPSDLTTQYLLIWITELPPDGSTDKYRIGVQEITVEAQ